MPKFNGNVPFFPILRGTRNGLTLGGLEEVALILSIQG